MLEDPCKGSGGELSDIVFCIKAKRVFAALATSRFVRMGVADWAALRSALERAGSSGGAHSDPFVTLLMGEFAAAVVIEADFEASVADSGGVGILDAPYCGAPNEWDGAVPLFLSTYLAFLRTTRELLAAGEVDVNAETLEEGRSIPTTLLLRAIGGPTSASADHRTAIVRALITAGADVNARSGACDMSSRSAVVTPLAFAITQPLNEGVVRALVDAGADINALCKCEGEEEGDGEEGEGEEGSSLSSILDLALKQHADCDDDTSEGRSSGRALARVLQLLISKGARVATYGRGDDSVLTAVQEALLAGGEAPPPGYSTPPPALEVWADDIPLDDQGAFLTLWASYASAAITRCESFDVGDFDECPGSMWLARFAAAVRPLAGAPREEWLNALTLLYVDIPERVGEAVPWVKNSDILDGLGEAAREARDALVSAGVPAFLTARRGTGIVSDAMRAEITRVHDATRGDWVQRVARCKEVVSRRA